MIDKSGGIRASNSIKFQIHKGLDSIKKKEEADLPKLKGYLSFTALIEPKYKSVQKQIYDIK